MTRRLAQGDWRMVLAMAGAVAVLMAGCRPPEARHALRRREHAFEVLGKQVAKAMPAAKVLVVGNPFLGREDSDPVQREAEAASVRGLERGLGLGSQAVVRVVPELKPGALEDPRSVVLPAGASTPISFMSVPGAWDALWTARPGANVIVSLVGVPADLATTRAWTDVNGPRWVLFQPDLRILGGEEMVREAMRSGRLLAVLMARRGAPPESEKMGGDVEADFARRFLLLTAESPESAWEEVPGG